MLFRLIPPALLLAAMGCSKKAPEPGGEPGGDPKADAPAYTIKLRGEQKGDKVHVVKTRDGETTTTVGKNKPQTKQEQYRYEYTETVLEMPPGSLKPTRSDRAYTTARKTDFRGELKPLSFEGKTVEVQVSPFEGVGYIFIVGGNAVQPPDRDDLVQEFQGGEKPSKDFRPKGMLEELLPKQAVKVGEEWSLDFTALKAFAGDPQFPFDKDTSKIVGKLAKVYEKDGKQHGVIEYKITMVLAPVGKEKGPPFSGTITTDVTIDGVIDGSSRERSVKMKGDGAMSAPLGKGAEVKVDLKITQEETVTPVK